MKNASRISIAALCAAAALGLAGCNSPSSGTAPEVAPVQVQAQDLTPMQKAAALGLAGCNSPSSGTAPEVAPVQVQAQDLTPMQKAAGVYAGELPCADCSGIRTTLYLRANGVYTRISEYVGRDTFEDGGQWTIDEKGVVTMTPAVKGGQPSLARVEEGAVRLLNADGDAVEGPMADLYVLKKDQ